MGWNHESLFTQWKVRTSSFFANDHTDSFPPPDAVRPPAACAPAEASVTHDSVIRTGLAEYPFIARKAQTMWGTAELDTFLTKVMRESNESARNGFETLDLIAGRAIEELIRMNRLTMEQRVAKPAPPTRAYAWTR